MIDSLALLEKSLSPRKRRDLRTRQALDHASVIQDDILDQQRIWLAGLPITDELRESVFKQFCVATGQLIDGLFESPQRAA